MPCHPCDLNNVCVLIQDGSVDRRDETLTHLRAPAAPAYTLARSFCGMGGSAQVGGGAGGGPSTRCGMLRRFSSALACRSTWRWRNWSASGGSGGGGETESMPPMPLTPPYGASDTETSDGRASRNRGVVPVVLVLVLALTAPLVKSELDPTECTLERFRCRRDRLDGERLRDADDGP